MSFNSLESLLNQMRVASVTRGWGAIAVFGQAQLNRLLEEQYLAWLSDSRVIPPISGNIVLGDGEESVELVDLFLGKPVLSFGSASLNRSVVTLTMTIIGGTYTAMSHSKTSPSKLISSFSITEEMGYKVELLISLGQVEGEVDKRGRVTLDLASDPDLKCNLGDLPAVQAKIAALIQLHLAALPVDTRTYELGLVDFSGYNPLSPRGFYIRTQKAPGAENPSSPNFGKGGVVVFIRLKINDENGDMPVEGGDFPYLIPDDQAQGADLYSASLVLSQQYLKLLEETQLDVLKNLLFPGENVFVESTNGRHTPFDLLVLGNVKATEENVRIQPPFVNLKDGKAQQFTALKNNDAAVNATWTVSNLIEPLSVGTIGSGSGVYTSPDTPRMGKERHPIVVTARYAEAGQQKTRSALVLAAFEGLGVSPRVAVSGIGSGARPIPLTVTSLTGGELLWPTLPPEQGTLTIDGNNHAIYTPPLTLPGKSLVVLTINVSEKQTNERIDATIVLLAGPHQLVVEPSYVATASASSPIQFHTEVPANLLSWEVLGEGSVDGNGLFTPPQVPRSRCSVVKSTYSDNGIPLASGFSVIQLTEQQEPMPQWSALQEFSIATIGGRTTAYANGCQQIPVLITIETKSTSVGGVEYDIPVSDAELATLKLVDKSTGAELPFVQVAQDGIEYGSGIQYAANKKRNRFRLYARTDPTQSSPLAPPETKNSRVRTRELYIQFAASGSNTFYARFQGAGNRTFNSNDQKEPNFEVTVHGETFLPSDPDPDPNRSLYKFKRDRVAQDPKGHDHPPGNDYPEWDYFSYYLWSTDYWRLTYTSGDGKIIEFVSASILENISTIQWESELLKETFFSYTGCAFNPANFEGGDSPRPEGLSFDPYLWGLMREKDKVLATSFVAGREPAAGEFVFSLHRVHDMSYWYDGEANGDKTKLFRQYLDPGIKLTLLDIDGNRHSLQVSFDIKENESSRDKLVLRRQS